MPTVIFSNPLTCGSNTLIPNIVTGLFVSIMMKKGGKFYYLIINPLKSCGAPWVHSAALV